MPDNQTLAWVAGFVDGEGCISVHKGYRNPLHLRYLFQIANTNHEAIKRLQALFGGSVKTIPSKANHKAIHCLTLGAGDAARMLKTIHPFLFIKQLQVELFLAARAAGKTLNKVWLLAEFRRLNKRGVF